MCDICHGLSSVTKVYLIHYSYTRKCKNIWYGLSSVTIVYSQNTIVTPIDTLEIPIEMLYCETP